jgi:hypothetical protein
MPGTPPRIGSTNPFSSSGGASSLATLADIANSINVRDYGAVGDLYTDDDAAVNAAATAAIARGSGLYFPPTGAYGGYRLTSLPINGETVLFGLKGNTGSGAESPLVFMPRNADWVDINANVWGVTKLTFRHFAGVAGTILSRTATTITFDRFVPPTVLATLPATTLISGFTATTFSQYYTNAGNVYRRVAPGVGVNTIAVNLPVHGGGDATGADGITWRFVNAGTTYTVGNFAWAQQWYFTGWVGSTITGVVPAPGEADNTPLTYAITVAGGRGYFASLEHKAAADRATAAIRARAGNDPRLTDCWFNAIPGVAVKRDLAQNMQGGIWEGNVVDLAEHGFYGDFTAAKITNNLFYGCTHDAIFMTSGQSPDISGNYFDSNNIDIDVFESTYVGGTIPGTVSGLSIRNNHSQLSRIFARVRGVPFVQLTGNYCYRTLNWPIYLINSSLCRVSENILVGAGEQRTNPGENYAYIQGEGVLIGNHIVNNSLYYVNPTQFAAAGVAFTAGFENYAVQNVWSGNRAFFIGATLNPPLFAANLGVVYSDDVLNSNGRALVTGVLSLTNPTGAQVQHRFVPTRDAGVIGVASKYLTGLNGASNVSVNTPSVNAATAFVAAGGIDAALTSDFIFDTPIAADDAGFLALGPPAIEINSTGTPWTVEYDTKELNVNGVLKNRPLIRLRNATTAAGANYTVAIPAGAALNIRFAFYA